MQSPVLDIRLFGTPVLRDCTRDDDEIRLPHKAFVVLARLLLTHRTVARDDVAFALWPDDPEEVARANLRRALYILTQALPACEQEWVQTTRTTMAWNNDAPCRLDVRDFELLLQQGDYAKAADIYTADLLATFNDDPWIALERERLREAQFSCLNKLIDAARAQRDYAEAIRCAKSALRIDPWREDFERILIALRRDAGDRAGAIEEYKRFAAALHDEMGVEPMAETTAEAMQSPEPSAPLRAPAKRMRAAVPSPISTFIGREGEINDLTQLLSQNRLVTIVGPGGVGKTRLALVLANRTGSSYYGGIDFVDVTPVTQSEFFVPAVTSALGLQDLASDDTYERLIDALGDEPRLLVLDNCERVIQACAEFTERMLRACPNLRILTTSREPLHVVGEICYDLSPLPLDDALTLLCERVRAQYPRFCLSDENAGAITSICKRLDGIPLAIELAASRARTLTPHQILERLDDRFSLLATSTTVGVPHQQTLRAAIDWSYDMLSERDARALRALAAFRGGADLSALQSIWEPHIPKARALDVLTALVEKSFVRVVSARSTNRYTLLETIREYLAEKLSEVGELEDARTRHAMYYTEFAESVEPMLIGENQTEAIARLSVEDENFRAILDLDPSASNTGELRLRLIVALRWYYNFRGMLTEAIAYLNRGIQLLANLPSSPSRDLLTLRLHASLGTTLMFAKSWAAPEAEAAYETANTLINAATDPSEAIWILWGIWVYHLVRGNMDAALDACDRLRTVAGEHGDTVSALVADMISLEACFYTGRFRDAVAFCNAFGAKFLPAEHRRLINLYTIDLQVVSLVHHSLACRIMNDEREAIALAEEAVELARSLNHPYSIAWTLIWGSTTYLLSGNLELLATRLDEGITIACKHEFSYLVSMAEIMHGWLGARRGAPAEGIAQMQKGLDTFQATGAGIAVPHFRTLLAETLAADGRTSEALVMLEAAQDQIERWNERWQLAEVYRVKGDILAAMRDTQGSVECYKLALATAALQGADGWLARVQLSEMRNAGVG